MECSLSNQILSIHCKDVHFEMDLRQTLWPCSVFGLLYCVFWRKSEFIDTDAHMKRKSLQKIEERNSQDKKYSAEDLSLPVLSGWASDIYRRILRTPFGRKVLLPYAKIQAEINIFQYLALPDQPTYYPMIEVDDGTFPHHKMESDELWKLMKPSATDHRNTISDYIDAYKQHTITPKQVAKNIISAIEDSEMMSPKMRMIIEFHKEDIMKQAIESTARWHDNKPLSVFDGVPIAVKDEMFLGGYPCRAGTPIEMFGVKKSLSDEGFMVRRLREGGAMFIGMANMHQLGSGITGINPSKYHGTCRNPYNLHYPAAGSSSGPASAVAAGLCPVALCADGGGSIRIPASVNGVVGIKATFGRISGTGFHANCDTVSHAGFIASTVRDSAITYGYLAGPDPHYPRGLVQPPPHLFDFENDDLSGMRIGIDWTYFNHSSREIADSCKNAVDFLVQTHGMEVVEISIPELFEAMRAHTISVLSEMSSYSLEVYNKHHDQLNADTEINFHIGQSFTAGEYFQAQKQRTRCMNILRRIFNSVDCIITPTCGDFMPKLNKDILKYGYTNLVHLSKVTRFSVLGNLTGHPSISVPVDYSGDHLPIGLLMQTTWWREDLLYRIALAVDGFLSVKKPKVYYDVMSNVSS